MKRLLLNLGFLPLFVFPYLFLISACGDKEFLSVAQRTDYFYSGEFMIFDQSYVVIDSVRFDNNFNDSPLIIKLSKIEESLYFRIECGNYGIYEVDFFRSDIDCLNYNDTEIILYEHDDRGNQLITVILEDDYFDKCYFSDDIEKPIQFTLKTAIQIPL